MMADSGVSPDLLERLKECNLAQFQSVLVNKRYFKLQDLDGLRESPELFNRLQKALLDAGACDGDVLAFTRSCVPARRDAPG